MTQSFCMKRTMTSFFRAAALLMVLLFGNRAMADQEGKRTNDPMLSGSVSDAVSRKPVKGVTISVRSSGNRLERSFTTDAQGRFIIPQLPAGEVTLVLEKKGYKTYRKEKLVLKEGMQVKLQLDISNEQEEHNLFQPLLRMIES